jgi:hypothetical protein
MRESVLVSSVLYLLISSLTSAACDSAVRPSKVEARPTPAPAPIIFPGIGEHWQLWTLTTTLTAVDDTENCFSQYFRNRLGSLAVSSMAVDRSGDTVSFDYDIRLWPTNDTRLTGNVSGRDFTARSEVRGFFSNCPDGTDLEGTVQSFVSGKFSDDGSYLQGEEQAVYNFSIATITKRYAWSAKR